MILRVRYSKIARMPQFYYISFKYEAPYNFSAKRISIKDVTNIKPLRDPHFTFDLREMEFMLTGHWDMWVEPTFKDDRLVRVRKEVNCNVALENEYLEMYILLTEHCAPAEPDDTLLPRIYEMEKGYWDIRDNGVA
jgi:hypothetical protein